MDQSNEFGYLIVRVATADGAIPIEGAQVVVTDAGDGAVIRILQSDRSGLTERIALPTPRKSASQVPNGGEVSSKYNIRTSKEGYYTVSDVFVPVYPTITSVQSVAMIPLEYGNDASHTVQPPPDDVYFDEGRMPNL